MAFDGDVLGDDAAAAARRIDQRATSLPDRTAEPPDPTVGVTHSASPVGRDRSVAGDWHAATG